MEGQTEKRSNQPEQASAEGFSGERNAASNRLFHLCGHEIDIARYDTPELEAAAINENCVDCDEALGDWLDRDQPYYAIQ